MNTFSFLGFMTLALLSLYFISPGHQDASSILTSENVSIMKESINNLTTVFKYHDLYVENVSMGKVVSNIGNSIVYPIAIQANTFFPLALQATSLNSSIIIIIIKIIILIFLITWIPKIIKMGIIIYFFIKEKKRNKERWYE